MLGLQPELSWLVVAASELGKSIYGNICSLALWWKKALIKK